MIIRGISLHSDSVKTMIIDQQGVNSMYVVHSKEYILSCIIQYMSDRLVSFGTALHQAQAHLKIWSKIGHQGWRQNSAKRTTALQKNFWGACPACSIHLFASINSRYSFFLFTPDTVLHVSTKDKTKAYLRHHNTELAPRVCHHWQASKFKEDRFKSSIACLWLTKFCSRTSSDDI